MLVKESIYNFRVEDYMRKGVEVYAVIYDEQRIIKLRDLSVGNFFEFLRNTEDDPNIEFYIMTAKENSKHE